jgi:hypothetical protein
VDQLIFCHVSSRELTGRESVTTFGTKPAPIGAPLPPAMQTEGARRRTSKVEDIRMSQPQTAGGQCDH